MRNPQSLMFEGTPGWSLQVFLWIASRVHEFIPETETSIFLTGPAPEPKTDDPQVVFAHRRMLTDIENKLNADWIDSKWHRSADKRDFERHAIWCYPTHLPEDTVTEAARLAQLHGAIPVFNPIGPLASCVFAGVPLWGIPAVDPMVKVRYAYEIMRLLSDVALQEKIRVPMMEHARQLEAVAA